ncbi:MAG: DNA-binding transcriptional LysR family regulator [Methylophilaceae bacterium]|jgi:DNA-binding transcriptional LysR family regulator|tara:strand:- start:1295 stop:2215 length:921 start_codon:yes stop_codon:yes gene_type:complete
MSIKLSIEALEVIDAIARKGSFAAAAESLFRVPSALTYTVRKLEEDLGLSLFDRSGHRAILTKAGEELIKEGRPLLEAAQVLESRVKRVATGIETDITIAISDLFSNTAILQALADFYLQDFGTRVKLTREVFGGSWDALITGRADISMGAPGDMPSGGGYATKLIGNLDFVFAVAPQHPLASLKEPLNSQNIIQYRAVAVADSSRNLPPRTTGILTGQDVLTVHNMESKLEAQIMGLGVGYVPKHLALRYAKAGKLIIKTVAESRNIAPTYIAWRNNADKTSGKAQQWLLKRLEQISLEALMPIE